MPAPLAAFSVDVARAVVRLDDEAAALLGITVAETRLTAVLGALAPESARELEQQLGAAATVDCALTTRQGRVLRALCRRAGTAVSGVLADISGTPAQPLFAIAETAPVVLAYVDANERFVYANRYYRERYGRRVYPGAPAREVLGPAYEGLRPHIEAALRGETVSFVSPVDRSDGTRLWVSATYLPHRGPDGKVAGVIAVSEDITAQRAAEQKLQQSEAQLRQMADLLPQIVWAAAPDGRHVFRNRRWYEYTGLNPEQGDALFIALVHPDDLAGVQAAVARAREHGEDYEIELRLRRHDGVYRWHLARSIFVRDGAGNVQIRLGTATDIHEQKVVTERERALGELTASPPVLELRARLAAAIAAQAVGGACALQLQDARGEPVVVRTGPEAQPHPASGDVLRSGAAVYDERSACVPLGAAGVPMGTLSVASLQRLDEGDRATLAELGRTLGWALENARLFEAQQGTLALLEAFLDHAPIGLSFLDRELRYVRINRVLAGINALDVAETLGRTLADVVPPVVAARVGPLMTRVLQTDEPVLGVEIAGNDGRIFLCSYYPVHRSAVEGSGIAGVGAAVVEITAQKAVERRLQHAIDERDEFVSIASHELRTPLTALALRLQRRRMLIERGHPPDVPALLEDTRVEERQVQRLARLVEDMLGVTRMRDGALQLERTSVDLAALVREVTDRLRDSLSQAGCMLALHLEPVSGVWDRDRLEQVLANLLANAMRYAAATRVTVAVRRDGGRALLEVSDEGIGIAAEDHERIFLRFERAAAERFQGGLGLGLYVCRQIARAHGGDIGVESTKGRGAKFTVWLPVG